MTLPLLIIVILLLLAVLALQLLRKTPVDLTPIQQANERTERAIREEFSRNMATRIKTWLFTN